MGRDKLKQREAAGDRREGGGGADGEQKVRTPHSDVGKNHLLLKCPAPREFLPLSVMLLVKEAPYFPLSAFPS